MSRAIGKVHSLTLEEFIVTLLMLTKTKVWMVIQRTLLIYMSS
ncbi:MAG: hypothetical protein QW836_08110 [Ignisphaera sp.]